MAWRNSRRAAMIRLVRSRLSLSQLQGDIARNRRPTAYGFGQRVGNNPFNGIDPSKLLLAKSLPLWWGTEWKRYERWQAVDFAPRLLAGGKPAVPFISFLFPNDPDDPNPSDQNPRILRPQYDLRRVWIRTGLWYGWSSPVWSNLWALWLSVSCNDLISYHYQNVLYRLRLGNERSERSPRLGF